MKNTFGTDQGRPGELRDKEYRQKLGRKKGYRVSDTVKKEHAERILGTKRKIFIYEVDGIKYNRLSQVAEKYDISRMGASARFKNERLNNWNRIEVNKHSKLLKSFVELTNIDLESISEPKRSQIIVQIDNLFKSL